MIDKTPLPTKVFEILKRQILTNEYKPGQKLNAKELEKEFNVSSTPIREAINLLMYSGLVTSEANQSVRVVDFTITDIIEINEICSLLDTSAVRLAMTNPNSRGKLEVDLLECLEIQEDSITNKIDRYDNLFHKTFYKYVNNKRLVASSLHYEAQFEMLISILHSADGLQKSLQDHKYIYQTFLTNDVDRTVEAMQKHFLRGKETLLIEYNKRR